MLKLLQAFLPRVEEATSEVLLLPSSVVAKAISTLETNLLIEGRDSCRVPSKRFID